MSNYNIRYTGNCENFFDSPNSFACAAGLHHGDTSDYSNITPSTFRTLSSGKKYKI